MLFKQIPNFIIPEKRSFIKCEKHRIIVEMSQVDLASTDDYRNAGTEMLNFWKPMFVNAAQRARMSDGEAD